MKMLSVKMILGLAAAATVVVGLLMMFRVENSLLSLSAPTHPDTAATLKDTMVCVPAGFFTMGSEQGESDEKPEHRVFLDSFWIDLYPVTNAQYRRFVNETNYSPPLYWKDPKCNSPNQPVTGVSYDDAMAYCAWRSKSEGREFRLPTEAEWEKAARGDDKRTYPWGNAPPNKKRATTEITEKMPAVGVCELGKSPYGVSDLVGSVWNWCSDWYEADYYTTSPNRNPPGPQGPTRKGRVVRGGNWVFLGCCSGTPEYALRTSRRNAFHPKICKKSLGFRCVKIPDSGAVSSTEQP